MSGPNFTIAFRNLRRNLLYNLIVIGGMSLGMAVLLAVFHWSVWHFSFDRSFPGYQNIYRLTIEKQDENTVVHPARILYGDIPNEIRKSDEFPEFQAFTRLAPFRQAVLKIDEFSFYDEYTYSCDSNFLKMFPVKVLQGNPDLMLAEPYSIVLTKSTAKKYFGDRDPMNQAIELLHQFNIEFNTYTVTGIIEDFPENSHFRINALTSFDNPDEYDGTSWVYVRLAPNCDTEKLLNRIPGFISEHIDAEYGKTVRAHIQKLTDIHLRSDKPREIQPNSSYSSLLILIIAAILVFLLGWFNFTLLSYSQKHLSMNRYIIQWQMGAGKRDFFKQNLSDNLITGTISLIISILLFYLLQKPANTFLGFNIINDPVITVSGIFFLIIFLLLTTIVTSFISTRGLYTTLSQRYLSNKPVGKKESWGRTWFIRLVIILEFVITFVLMVNLTMVRVHTTRSIEDQMGSTDSTTIQIPDLPRYIVNRYRIFKELLASHPQISEVTATMEVPTGVAQDAFRFSIDGQSFQEKYLYYFPVDTNFLRFYKIDLLYGYDFRSDYSEIDSSDTYILNETAARMINYEDPESLIGSTFELDFDPPGFIFPGKIVGICSDFQFSGPSVKQQPMIISPKETWLLCFTVRYNGEAAEAITIIEDTWKELFPGYPFRYEFTVDLYQELYNTELIIIHLLAAFTLISLLIAGTGLFALSGYFMDRKMYVSALKKVNGASMGAILLPELRYYMILSLVSTLFSVPLAWFLISRWIRNFAEQMSTPWWIYVSSMLILIVFSSIAVLYHSVRLARSNPISILRK
ncbi:MAG: ABC transporter permease [Bacteroidota bacterium]